MKIKNKYNHSRGTLCVARMINGEFIALKIDSAVWQQYTNAFSIL
jgi:hypothetical protein